MQGPKIRIERFKEGKIFLNAGDPFTLDINLGKNEGDQYQVGVAYKKLPEDVNEGDELWLDDGRLVLTVNKIESGKVLTTVVNSWELSDNKGINRRGGGLSAEALTPKDLEDIKLAAEMQVDFLAVSFPRNGADLDRRVN